jgi:hypothetical protein
VDLDAQQYTVLNTLKVRTTDKTTGMVIQIDGGHTKQ